MASKKKKVQKKKTPVKKKERDSVAAAATKRRHQPRALAVRKGPRGLSKRAEANKKINQQALREKIASGNHHAHILKSIEELGKTYDEIAKIKIMDKGQQAKYMTQLAFLKTKMDGQFKLLNKYLPDVRAIEFQEGESGNPFTTAAKAWAEALNKGNLQ